MIDIKIWYILPAILVFGLTVFLHELGHFLVAKACDVEIKEFSIGMGPRLCKIVSKKSGTEYSIRALPVGGYVSMLGEEADEEEKDTQIADNSRAFCNKKIWQRFFIMVAGPLMNLLLGFLIMTIMVASTGVLYSTKVEYRSNAGYALSESSGIREGDEILRIGKTRVHTRYEVTYEIMRKGTEPLDVTVLRDGEKITVPDVIFPTTTEEGMLFGGVDFYAGTDDFNLANILRHSFFRTCSTVKMVVDSFVDLIGGKYGVEALSGPVGITGTIGESVSGGFLNFLFVFAVIVINIGVFNLFPLPALDGGRIVFLVVEAILGRRPNPKIEGYVNAIGLALMFGLLIFVTFQDIFKLF